MLTPYIHALIKAEGAMTMARYMELALQHPKYGYYRQHDPLGRQGDFTTAPEISQMFGELIGLWCADVWRTMGMPNPFVLLELGPGRGTLMQDAMRATAKMQGFHAAMHLCLLECNADLRVMQNEKLATHFPKHLDDLSSLPPLPLIVVANEFFDALPVRQFVKTDDGWCERLVSVADNKLVFVLSPPDKAFEMFIPSTVQEAVAGFVYELSTSSLVIMRELAGHIVAYGGGMAVVDYGYTLPSGKGTVQAVSNHKYADVLENVGHNDLSTHVDFSMLAQGASGKGAKILPPIGQGAFLQNLGIDVRAAYLKHSATAQQAAEIDAAVHRLTDGSQMGTLFKVMGVMAPSMKDVAGFL